MAKANIFGQREGERSNILEHDCVQSGRFNMQMPVLTCMSIAVQKYVAGHPHKNVVWCQIDYGSSSSGTLLKIAIMLYSNIEHFYICNLFI